MKYLDRNGNLKGEDDVQDRLTASLYNHFIGRTLIKLLIHPAVSKAAGKFLDSRFSCVLIRPFVRAKKIDLSKCEKKNFNSYNDFFMRKLKASARPIDKNPLYLISPCDSKLTVYPISSGGAFNIKHTRYTVNSLLRNKKLAEKYRDGYACVFRLTVDDYHRYCYIDDGAKSSNYKIAGVLHTVNPVANDVTPIYKENSREYSILRSKHFGSVLMMEVGAMMVGKIVNRHGAAAVKRGQEKGHFEFGGSTVILLFQRDKVRIDRDILKNSRGGYETKVWMGEKIGDAVE